MKALIQRVSSASVTVEDQCIGTINEGLVILLGITHDDSEKDAHYLAEKCLNLRIFEDNQGKMNRSLLDINGEILVISQFTLYGDCRKGRRPSFIDAARPDHAIPLYELFVHDVKQSGLTTETGKFGANMLVDINNQGPVTLMLESQE